jgi:putative membrane protein
LNDAVHRTTAMSASSQRQPLLLALLAATIVALVVSGWRPYDRLTWLMEVLPVLVALPLLVVTRDRYPLTTLLYVLIFLHGLVRICGGA